ncbi:MAG: RNA methyltransferase [Proteobacteria bacterium]|nr:RNA methyltransferase [Pseudomonadota bacterium]MDE3207784.1 RNA methyltransferase [Pseudomonadota bacterium]
MNLSAKQISSSDNAFYKSLHKLVVSSRFRKQSGKTVLDGVHLIKSARENGVKVDTYIVTKRSICDPEIRQLLKGEETGIIELPDNLFKVLSLTNPEVGLVARVDIPRPNRELQSFVLILENIQDPGNLGSILRSAAASAVETVYLSSGCADVYSPRVLRAAQGAHFLMSIYEHADILNVAREFKGEVITTFPNNGVPYFDAYFSSPLALVLGNEGSGVTPALAACSTQKVKIPMPGSIESLNVAAAAAILLFERTRQCSLTKGA